MMNKTKKKNVYVKYAVIMCISGALGGILGGVMEMGQVHGVLTGIQEGMQFFLNSVRTWMLPLMAICGLGNLTSVGTLEISAFEKNDRLYIQIEDDGEGMDQEKVAEIVRFINTAKPVEGKKNIGIRNVNQRIKLACGEQYGIIIESTPYQGSRFTIQLPIMREGEGNET